MRRLGFLLVLCFLSSVSEAAPLATGDVATFMVSGPTSSSPEYSVRVTEERESGIFGILQTWADLNRPPLRSWLQVEQIETSLIGFSRDHAEEYFLDCEKYGKVEIISTPAGDFPACTIEFIDDPKNSYSISPRVPMGIVRKVSGPDEHGNYQRLLLKSFEFGSGM